MKVRWWKCFEEGGPYWGRGKLGQVGDRWAQRGAMI